MGGVVLDFEGFQFYKNRFIIKELAVFDLNREHLRRWTFQPPFSFLNLNKHERRQYFWTKNNTHGYEWYYGELPYIELYFIFEELFQKYENIYIKGVEKTKFVQYFTSRKCINLENLGCPKITELSHFTVNCNFKHSNRSHCALIKAESFGRFLKYKWNLANKKNITSV